MAELSQSRVYIRRQGRMTRAQARALQTLLERYRVPVTAGDASWATRFGRDAPLAVEIGFGMGHALLATAQSHPDWNCVGIEVYRPGIGALLNHVDAARLENVRIIEGDARVALASLFDANSLHRVMVFFPDPWPKSKHHKRRLINAEFAALVASRARAGRPAAARDGLGTLRGSRCGPCSTQNQPSRTWRDPAILRRATSNARRLDSKPAACASVIPSGISPIGVASQKRGNDRVEEAQSERRHRQAIAAHQATRMLTFPLSGDRRGREPVRELNRDSDTPSHNRSALSRNSPGSAARVTAVSARSASAAVARYRAGAIGLPVLTTALRDGNVNLPCAPAPIPM